MRTETHEFEDGSRSVFVYDDADRQVRTTDYDSNGALTFDIHYTYNESGDAIGWQVFNGTGEMIRRCEVDYDSNGLETEDREYGADGRLVRRGLYFYDAEGRKTGEQHYDAEGNLMNETAA
jgi:hypothetical protein